MMKNCKICDNKYIAFTRSSYVMWVQETWGCHKVLARGGSRTCRRRGRQPVKRGRQPNILYIFSEKPHDIKEILVCRGRAPGASPLDPPLQSCHKSSGTFCVPFPHSSQSEVSTDGLQKEMEHETSPKPCMSKALSKAPVKMTQDTSRVSIGSLFASPFLVF